MRALYLLMIICLVVQCKTEQKQDVPVSPKLESVNELPPIPASEFQDIFTNSNYVDYSFYNQPFSMSYDNQTSIRSVLKWVGEDAPTNISNCVPLCRMIFLKDGNIMIEAEIYISAGCAHYIWYVDNQKKYSNVMAAKGKQHYTQIVNQYNNKQ